MTSHLKSWTNSPNFMLVRRILLPIGMLFSIEIEVSSKTCRLTQINFLNGLQTAPFLLEIRGNLFKIPMKILLQEQHRATITKLQGEVTFLGELSAALQRELDESEVSSQTAATARCRAHFPPALS